MKELLSDYSSGIFNTHGFRVLSGNADAGSALTQIAQNSDNNQFPLNA